VDKLTFDDCERLHREGLWAWLAETGSNRKEKWPRWKRNGGDVEENDYYCFCCIVADDICRFCPIDWGNDLLCFGKETAFGKWRRAKTAKTRKKYAAIIAELPWKEGGWR